MRNVSASEQTKDTLDRRSSAVDIDAPATAEELARFRAIQARFSRCFTEIFDDPNAPRTVLFVPSLSVDQEVIAKITGAHHYEERADWQAVARVLGRAMDAAPDDRTLVLRAVEAHRAAVRRDTRTRRSQRPPRTPLAA